MNRQQLSEITDAVEPRQALYKSLRDTLRSMIAILRDTSCTFPSFYPRQQLVERIDALSSAMNTVRWLRCFLDDRCILVNIPAAGLTYFENGDLRLYSKVILGKPSTPTGTLSSQVTDVILYPYWTVPAKIASRELLPLIKRHPGYLADNNYQVISKGKLIDPTTVDWNKFTSSNFPYILRQSTGCDNSLGIIKLNFINPYGIYLHDTPWKPLFNAPKRFLSHGCIRVEKVTELSRLLLKGDSILLNEIIQKGDSLNTQPTPLRLVGPTPVVVVYETAWPDQSGIIRFFDDIYRKNNRP